MQTAGVPPNQSRPLLFYHNEWYAASRKRQSIAVTQHNMYNRPGGLHRGTPQRGKQEMDHMPMPGTRLSRPDHGTRPGCTANLTRPIAPPLSGLYLPPNSALLLLVPYFPNCSLES